MSERAKNYNKTTVAHLFLFFAITHSNIFAQSVGAACPPGRSDLEAVVKVGSTQPATQAVESNQKVERIETAQVFPTSGSFDYGAAKWAQKVLPERSGVRFVRAHLGVYGEPGSQELDDLAKAVLGDKISDGYLAFIVPAQRIGTDGSFSAGQLRIEWDKEKRNNFRFIQEVERGPIGGGRFYTQSIVYSPEQIVIIPYVFENNEFVSEKPAVELEVQIIKKDVQ